MTNFAMRLRSIRASKNMTQEDLAKKSGVNPCVISFYEAGSRKPGLDNIMDLCRGLGCTATELLGI